MCVYICTMCRKQKKENREELISKKSRKCEGDDGSQREISELVGENKARGVVNPTMALNLWLQRKV